MAAHGTRLDDAPHGTRLDDAPQCGLGSKMPSELPLVTGFTRTCRKDVELAMNLLRSVCKFGSPLISDMTVTYAKSEAPQLEPLLHVAFPWAHARPSTVDERIGSFFQNHTGRHVTTAAGKSFFVPGGVRTAASSVHHSSVNIYTSTTWHPLIHTRSWVSCGSDRQAQCRSAHPPTHERGSVRLHHVL